MMMRVFPCATLSRIFTLLLSTFMTPWQNLHLQLTPEHKELAMEQTNFN